MPKKQDVCSYRLAAVKIQFHKKEDYDEKAMDNVAGNYSGRQYAGRLRCRSGRRGAADGGQ